MSKTIAQAYIDNPRTVWDGTELIGIDDGSTNLDPAAGTADGLADYILSLVSVSLPPGDYGDVVIDTDGVWTISLAPGDYGDIVIDTDGLWIIDPAVLAGYAAKSQTEEMISGYIGTIADKTYKLVVKAAHGGTITEATTISESGTVTAMWKINTTALGGAANSVSTSETSQAHASANVFAAGDDIQLTTSANAACLGMSFTLKYTRTYL